MILSRLNTFLVHALAIVWATAGVSKLVQLVFRSTPPTTTNSWSDQFSPILTAPTSILEILVAIALIAGYRRAGLLIGLLMLASFSVAVVISPPQSGQSCGCLGDIAHIDAKYLLAHIVLLVGTHTLAWASLPNNSTSQNSAQPQKTIKNLHPRG